MQIATLQRKEIDFLRETLGDLEGVAGRAAREPFTVLSERLDNWAARVAVIGQVKAGKSTFLNAFLGQHNFLPSDVNPWTSVVTNIRINLTNDPKTGASFEFFDENSWDEIINGGSEVRKLTEQLLPGFDADLLRKQTEEMKERAQKRLGKYYHTLLGTSHDYDFLTPDLLQRYVCAGPSSEQEGERDALGRYAAITKVANLYFRRPEFAVPTIITDTPGVNDPFLVRDEFTCRSLDKSDVFIVVLSAHQALTEVDIALMRILAQQETKDVVIFINRIDELDDYDLDIQRVTKDVASRLKEAIPNVEFTIHAGSAYLADLALRDDEEAAEIRNELDDDRLANYVRSITGSLPTDQRERFFAAAGLEDVRRTMSNLIDHGVGSQQIGQIVEDVRSEIGGLLFVSKRERDSIQMQVEKLNIDRWEDSLKVIEAELGTLSGIQVGIDENYESSNAQIDKIVSKSWASLEASLNESIGVFIDEQRDRIKERVFRNSVASAASNTLNIDLLPLREHLEADIKKNFDKARAGIDVVLSNFMSVSLNAVSDKFEIDTDGITLQNLPNDTFVSTLTLSKKKLDLVLIANKSWAFWRRKNIDVEKSLDALRIIAAAELRPAIQKILAAFSEACVERAVAGQTRLQVIPRMVDSTVEDCKQRLRTDRAQVQRLAADPDALNRLAHRLQSQLEILDRRIQHVSVCDSHLAKNTLAQAA
ncbi:dynamin family protein [Puniceibacterium sp. IMCC21224]|uniref:dynamin family protein n=1 Tax=Puniceibacterium sp. IMCC21224 TaxID=1618204 RepID=UPI00064DA04A|nr:dynamin family protein [Puniceibacterium sp. IMCC21224]KMK66433.1 dynamin family protein [Puniceibacterium sp. IMCC21224]